MLQNHQGISEWQIRTFEYNLWTRERRLVIAGWLYSSRGPPSIATFLVARAFRPTMHRAAYALRYRRYVSLAVGGWVVEASGRRVAWAYTRGV